MDLAGRFVRDARTRQPRGHAPRSEPWSGVGARLSTLWRALPLILLAACATEAPEAPPESEGLVDRIWRVSDGAFVEQDELLALAMASSHVLLGEVHINPHHHDAQTEFLAALIAEGARPAVVFEMFHRDQQDAIDGLREGMRPDAGQIAAATDFEERGWDWPFYAALVELALAEDLPILAGNAPRQDSRSVVMDGFAALPHSARDFPGLDRPLPAAAEAALVDTMVASHCGHAMGDLANRLVAAQRLRDASMACPGISRPAASATVYFRSPSWKSSPASAIRRPTSMRSTACRCPMTSCGSRRASRGRIPASSSARGFSGSRNEDPAATERTFLPKH